MLLLLLLFSVPSIVKIPRAKNMKLKSTVGIAGGPVLHRREQRYRVLKLN